MKKYEFSAFLGFSSEDLGFTFEVRCCD